MVDVRPVKGAEVVSAVSSHGDEFGISAIGRLFRSILESTFHGHGGRGRGNDVIAIQCSKVDR